MVLLPPRRDRPRDGRQDPAAGEDAQPRQLDHALSRADLKERLSPASSFQGACLGANPQSRRQLRRRGRLDSGFAGARRPGMTKQGSLTARQVQSNHSFSVNTATPASWALSAWGRRRVRASGEPRGRFQSRSWEAPDSPWAGPMFLVKFCNSLICIMNAGRSVPG